MSAPGASSPSSRLRLAPHASPMSVTDVARNSIISSSAKGWSPLQINKRDSINTSPLKPSPNPSLSPNTNDPTAPRRSSSSFKHVSKNSLVSNSPFKSPTTVQGAQAIGLNLDSSAEKVIHERRSTRQLGETPPTARGSAATSKAAIGLGIGISPTKPRSTSRSASGEKRAAVSGQRRVSSEWTKIAFPSVGGVERRASIERRVSAAKENESPDVRSGKRVPRASMGFKDLAKGSLVTKSPFKQRTPSGGLGSTSSTRANENASDNDMGPSPKTVPVERDDVFSSPSPRRLSGGKQGQRRASPSSGLGVGARTSDSPTPSPPRSIAQPFLTTTTGSAGPSPLSQSLSLGQAEPTATPTPHKSAMTPSRRLRGPRDLAAGCESPTRKTVTFQSVPDVKEFECLSAEPSMDGSFEVHIEEEDADEWVDETYQMQRDNSLDELLSGAHPIGNPVIAPSPMISDESEGQMPDGSTTAAFMDTLIEEGLFSPPTMDTPAFEDQEQFELPLEPVDHDSDRPFLSTPSLGGSVNVTPLLASEMFPETDQHGVPYGRTHHAERAAAAHAHGAETHASGIYQPGLPHNQDHNMLMNANASQPALPKSPTHYPEYNDPFASSTPHAHQVGVMPDPFITIQTATNVLPIQHQQRTEDGIPLGRTSHAERIQARRMLATQSLGLGMPRSPAISQGLTREYSEDKSENGSEGEHVSEGEILTGELRDVRGEHISRAPPALAPVVMARNGSGDSTESTTKRRLPKVPAPAPIPIDIPSPVTSPAKNNEVEQDKLTVAEKRSSRFELGGFSLPFIGSTSPFFNNGISTFEKQPSVDGDGRSSPSDDSSHDVERPLTPPPAIKDAAEEKKESPHRLPDFNFHFEEIQLQRTDSEESRGTASIKANQVVPVKASTEIKNNAPIDHAPAKPDSTITPSTSAREELSKMPSSASGTSLRSEFGGSNATTPKSVDSTTTRVRQRISREMIRETIQQRIAEGSLSRRPPSTDNLVQISTPPVQSPVSPTRERRISILDKEKALPPPPAETVELTPSSSKSQELAPQMSKAHTTDAAPRQVSGARPAMRPRSQTQSAHEVLKQNERDGILNEPRSALDKLASSLPAGTGIPRDVSGSIAAEMPPPPSGAATLKDGRPVSILRNPYPNPNKQDGLLPPANVTMNRERSRSPTPTGEGMQAREQAIIAKRREKERDRNVSGISTGSRRSRRSLSMGDADQEAKEVKTFRRSVMGNPRLTLGIDDDQQSILDAFREEINSKDRGYKVRERAVVRASYHDKVGHSRAGGDIDSGKAWRTLRRPSDMNEHAAEIRAMRARESYAGKTSGTIFVKVLGIESLQVPLPDQPTYFSITLDNGIDYIRTPYSVLADGARVNQEFSLVEHPNFEFSLSLDIRRDPHILKMLHEKNEPAPPVAPAKRPVTPASPASKHSGFRALFASPRKPKGGREARPITPVGPVGPVAAPAPKDTIVKYLSTPTGSTIAKTHIAFKPIAKNCDSRVLEIRYPMFAITTTAGSNGQARKQLAKITLQIFRLPPIPGLAPEDLPQCIDECLRGMRHHAWHEHEYHEGILTQEGGDCTHPKRRLFKLIGGNLVAINEVTKKEVTKIDLRQALSVVDLNAEQGGGTPKSRMTMRPRGSDEGFGARPRSFLLEFKDGDNITFAADTDKAKETWMETLEGLIGKIPSNPLWAELLATRQRERAARRTASSSSLAKEARRQASASGGPGSGSGISASSSGRPVSMPLTAKR
ncbi:hypothetical protein I317_05436 [Kwoniella heveanensis CBS 569]|nr:hypothetical protein I317_05436 [Kwoniella heveanensis CBS 569]